VTEIESLVHKHFPFEKPNPGQLEAIVRTIEAFEDGKHHVIAQMPCGTGKSAVATTVHRVMAELRGQWRTTIITATKQLQDQYVSSDNQIFDLKGRNNFGCPHKAGPYNSPSCRTQVKKGCKPKEVCPYVQRRIQWCNMAQLRSTNFSFQIEAPPQLCMTPDTQANAICIDEAHAVDEALIEHASIKINTKDFDALAAVGFEWVLPKIVNFIDIFSEIDVGTAFEPTQGLIECFHDLSETLIRIQDELSNQMEESGDMREVKGIMVDAITMLLGKTENFGVGGDEWILVKYTNGSEVELKPVYSEQVAYHGLMRKAEYFLHMSATICGFEQYMESLGLDPDDCEIIDVANPIPVKNRRVIVIPKFKMNASFNDWPKLVGMIDKLIERHGKENGIIHCVSFKLGETIKQYSKFASRMIVTGDRFEIDAALNKHNSGAIVISPSIERGVDLKGDMSRWQIIPKVPFLFLGDPFVRLNCDRHPDWYARRAILRIVQASGRSIRGVDDYAATYILDSNFVRLHSQNRDIFPQWFTDALRWVE
jgi:ATP-dependent DNA helicase DinG